MSKVTYEQKIELLDRYAKKPMSIHDPEIITAIKVDVIKGASKGVRRASDPEPTDNKLYNECMGAYRQFLSSRNSHLDMKGKKAKIYSEAMRDIIDYIRRFQASNSKPNGDEDVLKAWQFILSNWDRLNDFHRNRLALTDIYSKIEEIIPMIKNGYNKKSASKNSLDELELSLKRGK